MDEIIEEPNLAPLPAPHQGGMYLTEMAVYDLSRAAKWAQFLAIVGFIGAGIMAIVAFCMSAIFSAIPTYGAMPGAIAAVVTVFYLIIAAVVFIVNLYLYQFASRTLKAVEVNDIVKLENGVHRLQSYFKAFGIIMIVYIALFSLAFIFSIGMGTMLRH